MPRQPQTEPNAEQKTPSPKTHKKTTENLSEPEFNELSESVSDQDLKIALKHLAETIKT